MRLDLGWHPYKIQRKHQLLDGDFPRRRRFCEWLLERNRANVFLRNLIISDEAGFWMNGRVSSQNVRKYAPKGENPDFSYEVNFSKEKIIVWMGLSGGGNVIGPFFFDRNVNGQTYLEMLNELVFPELINAFGDQFRDGHFSRLWWAQDGAPAHTTVAVSEWMTEFFRHKIIAINHPVEWPPRSPDLTPCDYFLWGYLKSQVYKTPPRHIIELRERIVAESQKLKENPELIQRAMRGMIQRARTCIANNGRHVQGAHG